MIVLDRPIFRSSFLLLLLVVACVTACDDGGHDDAEVAVPIFDGPSRKHPREMMTAATLFDGAVSERAHRLETQVLSHGNLNDLKNRDFIETEMRGASVDLKAVDASAVATFRKGTLEADGAWMMVSLGSDDAARRILVTQNREAREMAAGVGSQSLEATVFLETLRLCTLARVATETAEELIAVDFVMVLDGGTGFDFLSQLPRFDGVYVGLLVAEEFAAAEPAKRVLLGRVDRDGTVLANCLESVLADFSGHPAAWGEVGMEGNLGTLNVVLGAEAAEGPVPRAELRAASGPKGRDLTPLANQDERIRAKKAPPLHDKVGTALDRVDEIAGPGVPVALASARALALILLRCEASFAEQ